MNNNASVRVNRELKEEAEALFEDMGMDISTAFNIFMRQAIRNSNFPFEITGNIPNAETRAAFIEGDMLAADPNVKTYSSVEELLEEDLA